MNTLDIKPLAESLSFNDSDFSVHLKDARTITVPLAWFPKLNEANDEQLHNYIIMGDGEGIHWPDIDEDISVNGLLFGRASKDAA